MGADGFRQSFKGILLAVPTGNALVSWYRQSAPGTTYNDLLQLICQKYTDVLSKSATNIEANIGNLFAIKDGDSFGMIQPIDTICVEDDPAAPYSVQEKTYLMTNAIFNYIRDSVQTTLVETRTDDTAAGTVLTKCYELQ
jgi:hypothetical protein